MTKSYQNEQKERNGLQRDENKMTTVLPFAVAKTFWSTQHFADPLGGLLSMVFCMCLEPICQLHTKMISGTDISWKLERTQ